MTKSRVVMVGTFPPPVHGMAKVNAAMLERLRACGADPIVINLAAPNLDRRMRYRLQRIPKIVAGWLRVLFTSGLRGDAFYIGFSGGFGQVYDAVFLWIARLRGMRRFIHHHNYTYLTRHWWVTRLVIAMAGKRATHIVLCDCMSDDLKQWYPRVERALVLSNVWLLDGAGADAVRVRTRCQTLGFLSNISAEKGVFVFLDTVSALVAKGCDIKAKLAGPFQGIEVERTVRQRLRYLPCVEYVGAKYGAEKEAFYESIDVLLFPTHNEADSLTIYEAMTHSVSVIAWGRGCIPSVIADGAGVVVDTDKGFVAAAASQVRIWCDQPRTFMAACTAARQRFLDLREGTIENLEGLMHDIQKDA